MTLGERLTYLEGQVEEQSRAFVGLREALAAFEERADRRFEAVDRRFEAVDRRLDAIEDKLSRHFQWLVGIQITTLVAIVAALLSRN